MSANKIRKRIQEIKQEIKETPYHKGTERHIGRLRARLSELKEQAGFKSQAEGGGGPGFGLKKRGDGTCVLVGLPSVGKSTLLNKLTNAQSKVASYPFTTLKVIPGMLEFKGAQIQILDVPGLIKGAGKGKGKGKQILSVVRVADLLILVISAEKPQTLGVIKKELAQAGVSSQKKEILVLSKTDQVSDQKLQQISKELEPGAIPVSSKTGQGLEELKQVIFDQLNLIRTYLKESLESEPQLKPLILKKGATVREAAQKISQELAEQIEGARISGPSAKHPNQLKGLDHKISDQDRIFFVKKS